MAHTSYSGLGTFVVVASWIEAGGAWSCSYLVFEMDKKGDMSSSTTLRPVFSHPFMLWKTLGKKKSQQKFNRLTLFGTRLQRWRSSRS
jgi:hypothetical protein